MTLLLFLDRQEGMTEELAAVLATLEREPVPIETRVILTRSDPVAASLHGVPAAGDVDGLATARYAAAPGTCYLIRPDQHVIARWRSFAPDAVRQAASRALVGDGALAAVG